MQNVPIYSRMLTWYLKMYRHAHHESNQSIKHDMYEKNKYIHLISFQVIFYRKILLIWLTLWVRSLVLISLMKREFNWRSWVGWGIWWQTTKKYKDPSFWERYWFERNCFEKAQIINKGLNTQSMTSQKN